MRTSAGPLHTAVAIFCNNSENTITAFRFHRQQGYVRSVLFAYVASSLHDAVCEPAHLTSFASLRVAR